MYFSSYSLLGFETRDKIRSPSRALFMPEKTTYLQGFSGFLILCNLSPLESAHFIQRTQDSSVGCLFSVIIQNV